MADLSAARSPARHAPAEGRLEIGAAGRRFPPVVGELVRHCIEIARRSLPRWPRRPFDAGGRAGELDSSSSRVSRTIACANRHRSAPTSSTSAARPASSSASSTASTSVPSASASTSTSTSRPMTAAIDRTRSVSSPRRLNLRPTTSRMPSGMPKSEASLPAVQAPSCSTMAPVSARWRRISPTKNGFPAVSSHTAVASVRPGVSSG